MAKYKSSGNCEPVLDVTAGHSDVAKPRSDYYATNKQRTKEQSRRWEKKKRKSACKELLSMLARAGKANSRTPPPVFPFTLCQPGKVSSSRRIIMRSLLPKPSGDGSDEPPSSAVPRRKRQQVLTACESESVSYPPCLDHASSKTNHQHATFLLSSRLP